LSRIRFSVILLAIFALLGGGNAARAQADPPPYRLFLPLALPAPAVCQPTGASYASLPVNPPPTDRPAARHPDLNLSLRGYAPASAPAEYIWIGGPTDERAPQLTTLFAPPRRPDITGVWQVYDWDWTHDRRGDVITSPPVTLASLDASAGEWLHLPDSGYDLGQGYEALVLYAEHHRITLKYTREDNVVWGYTLHLENICVDPNLLALYQALDARGRVSLPALRAGQPFAQALSTSPGVVIRDNGSFMDPRSRKDWWRQ
jgi:hypothetical protein